MEGKCIICEESFDDIKSHLEDIHGFDTETRIDPTCTLQFMDCRYCKGLPLCEYGKIRDKQIEDLETCLFCKKTIDKCYCSSPDMNYEMTGIEQTKPLCELEIAGIIMEVYKISHKNLLSILFRPKNEDDYLLVRKDSIKKIGNALSFDNGKIINQSELDELTDKLARRVNNDINI